MATKANVSTCPTAFKCPITHLLLEHPVITTGGNTYEYIAISAWLADKDTDPLTNERLRSKVLVPNLLLRQVQEWIARNPAAASRLSGDSGDDWVLVLDYHKGAHALQLESGSAEGTGSGSGPHQRLLVTEKDTVFSFDLVAPANLGMLSGSLPVVPGRLCDGF